MSSALAIAGVTAVIKDLLDNGLIDQMIPVLGTQFKTTALPPDMITLGTDQSPQLNLFMWQATPNAAWRNMGYPSRDSRGNRISNPSLALDLHYLLSAYGSTDLQAEILLGYAMQLLHETPVLARDAIRKALNPPGPPVDPPTDLPGAARFRSRRPVRTDQDRAVTDEHGGHLEALDRLAGALSSNGLVHRNRGADRIDGGYACGTAGTHARRQRSGQQ